MESQWSQTPSCEDFQSEQRSEIRREADRRGGALSGPAGACAGVVRRRKKFNPGAG